jgi:electron transfer flavoprotein beta subunit
MKIIVGVKQVVDFNVHIKVKADGSGVETDNVRLSMNPFDEIAVEAGVQLRETGKASETDAVSEVIVVFIGPEGAKKTLRNALAMGADRAILIQTTDDLEPLAVAKLLEKVVKAESASLALLGKQAIDNDCNQSGQMLAGLLGWPQATFASTLFLADKTLEIEREVEGGLQKIRLPLPAVVSVDLRLNQPRYATLPAIMKAKKKPLEVVEASDFGLELTPRLTILETEPPEPRKKGQMVASIAELVEKLKEEAGVL